jgi:hypothetical protein
MIRQKAQPDQVKRVGKGIEKPCKILMLMGILGIVGNPNIAPKPETNLLGCEFREIKIG